MPTQCPSTVSVGRQPIFSKNQQLFAYELLHREGGNSNSANVVDGDIATANVLTNAIVEIGLDRLVGDALAFVNFTRTFLDGTTPIPLEHERLVVEVLESESIDENLVEGVANLSEAGYRIALDDFVYSSQWDPLLRIADIVKIDVLSMTEKEVINQVQLLRRFDIALLAEKVETYDHLALCTKLGFELFQGYFFARPNVFKEKRASASQAALVGTLAAVNDPEAGPREIDAAVSQDAMLTHKFMRYVNSSSLGRRSKVETVEEAIVYLGKERIRAMSNLLLLTSIDDKPPALMRTALIRAINCENLAQALGKDNPQAYFAAGLLSMLDAFLDRPLPSIVKELPVTDSLKNALLEHQGPMGMCLKAAIGYERADQMVTEDLPLSASEQYLAYLDAITTVEQHEGMASLLPSPECNSYKDSFRRKRSENRGT